MSDNDSDSDDSDFADVGREDANVFRRPAAATAKAMRRPAAAVAGRSSERSTLEHHYIMGRAREAKLRAEAATKQEEDEKNETDPEIEKSQNMLDSCFQRCSTAADAAKSLGVHHRTVLQRRCAVNSTMMPSFVEKLREWRRVCEETPPVIAIHGRKFDSATVFTSSDVILPALGKLARSQTRRPVHFFVQRRMIMLIFEDKAVELKWPVHDVLAATTSASCLHECVDTTEQIKEMQEEAIKILQTAQVLALEADGMDGAYANLKYEFWRDGDGSGLFDFEPKRHHEVCGNHGSAIHQGLIHDAIGKDNLDYVTSFSKFDERRRHVAEIASRIISTYLGGFASV